MPSEMKTITVSGLRGNAQLFVMDVGKHAQRKALGTDRDRFTGTAEDGLYGAGVGHLQNAVLVVPERKEHGDVLRFQLALMKRAVELGKHLCRLRVLHGGGAHDAAGQGGEECGRRSLCR